MTGDRLPLKSATIVVDGHLDPRYVSLVGGRSHEPEEAELLARLGVNPQRDADRTARLVEDMIIATLA